MTDLATTMPRPRAALRHCIGLFCALGSACLIPHGAAGQNVPFDAPTQIAAPTPEADQIGFRAGSFVAAPIPFESPSLDSGLALGGAYLFKNDLLSDASSIGFGAFRTTNESQGYGLSLNMAWNEGRWTAKLLLAEADLNFDLFIGQRPIPVQQSVRGAAIELAHRPSGNFAFGGAIAYGEYRLNLQSTGPLPNLFARDAELDLARVSGFFEFDTRDDTFYPTQGSLLKTTLTRAQITGHRRRAYSKALIAASGYWPIAEQSVIAGRATACLSDAAAPFFDSCALGVADNFRGYLSTEFIDDALVSVQAELRTRISPRLGLVAFAGAGSVGDTLGTAFESDLMTAAGVGLRVRLSKSFPIDYAIDLATNERDEQLLYVSVGQRF